MLTWPHTSSPNPINTHHIHWSSCRGEQLNGFPPNWTITIYKEKQRRNGVSTLFWMAVYFEIASAQEIFLSDILLYTYRCVIMIDWHCQNVVLLEKDGGKITHEKNLFILCRRHNQTKLLELISFSLEQNAWLTQSNITTHRQNSKYYSDIASANNIIQSYISIREEKIQ